MAYYLAWAGYSLCGWMIHTLKYTACFLFMDKMDMLFSRRLHA